MQNTNCHPKMGRVLIALAMFLAPGALACGDSSSGSAGDCGDGSCGSTLEPPTGVRATAEAYAVRLSWEQAWAEDFVVSRRERGDADFVPIASSTQGAREYLDTAILLGKTYQYSIQAVAGDTVSPVSEVVEASPLAEPADWTLLYFISSDGDYPYTYWFNIEAMQAQGGSSERVNVMVLYDGFPRGDSRYYRIGDSAASNEVFEIPTAVDGEVNMGDPEAYFDFIDWLFPRYTARHYLVSFHDHGGGAVDPSSAAVPLPLAPQSMLWDETSGDSLGTDEQAWVIAHLADRADVKVDVVESMVCLGQMIENTFGMAGHAQYHIGAESLSYVTTTFPIGFLADNPDATGEDVATYVVTDHYHGIVQQGVPCHWSMIDLDYMDELAELLSELALELLAFANTEQRQELVRNVVGGAQNFQYTPGDISSAYVDIKDMALQVQNEPLFPDPVHQIAQSIADVFDNGLVPYNKAVSGTDPYSNFTADYQGAFGLSVYHPNQNNPYYLSGAYETLTFAETTGWNAYLRAISIEPPSGPCPVVENLEVEVMPEGTVEIGWSYDEAHFNLYDGFFCSRDRDGVYTGEYQTIFKEAGKTSFVVVDNPTLPGTYTWRVTAVRFADQLGSWNWVTTDPVEISQ